MTREYELVYIFDSTLEEAQVTERLDRFTELLRSPESPEPVTAVSHWGKRTLAYPIKGRDVGYYAVVQFVTQPDRLSELERAIRLDEAILRHLVVVNEGLAPVAAPRADGGSAEGTDEDAESGEGS